MRRRVQVVRLRGHRPARFREENDEARALRAQVQNGMLTCTSSFEVDGERYLDGRDGGAVTRVADDHEIVQRFPERFR